MRDGAAEEGYITRAQRETTGPERKRKHRWDRRAWRKSLALILYGRCVSSLSLAPVLANLSVVFCFTNVPSFSFSLPFTNFRQDILNVDLITAKPTSYSLIQFPLSSAMNLSFRVAPRISPAVVSHSLHLRYTETYRNAVSNDKSHSVLGLGSLAQGHCNPLGRVWKLPANIHFWFTFA
jgi:hypothetical protein